MLGFIKKLFGPGTDYKELVKNGAVIIDVRTPGEFSGGNIKGSVNIPLDSLGNEKKKLPSKDKVIITCCASGMRSAAGKSMLKSKGYTAYNGGGYMALQRKLS